MKWVAVAVSAYTKYMHRNRGIVSGMHPHRGLPLLHCGIETVIDLGGYGWEWQCRHGAVVCRRIYEIAEVTATPTRRIIMDEYGCQHGASSNVRMGLVPRVSE